ncbi:uncharacterized protein LOC110233941 isoform X2 [Exaiptasia diaphana]|uniref:Uncharacterized protein n=1 Tax=Exaiptasia diaphana TaxID=2652724 RepID=A0A913WVZ6_EXADI|nr:uncharacterized protein LOC110233941 isoform X2 [Exaiptasia diaphana]
MNKSGDILGYSTMESVRQRNDPDSENRLSLGGKNRSNRRSSILKTSKSPMKALEDRDPNSMESDKENRDMKSRRSSNRRVSFAQTYEVKEFSKDDGWSEWEKASISNTDKKIEKEEYLPSEYRPANVTIKGLESLLKGDIQNPERQQQAGSDMDFITFCTSAFNEPSQSDLNRTVGFSNDDTLDLTCHGQGVIDHENRAPNVTSNYDNMDFTVCQPKMYSDETADSTNRTEHTLDMTCHGHGVITSDDCYQGPKFCPSSFLQSLVVKPSQEFVPSTSISHTTAQQHQVTAQQPQKTDAASLSSTELPKQVASQQGSTNVPSRSFLESLVTSTPFNDDEEEEMEMTTCLEVPLETTNETMPDSSIVLEVGPQQPTLSSKPKQGRMFYETQMDMTSCVSSSMTPQGQSMAQVAQMDMPSIMTQTHSVAQGMGHVPLLARSLGNSQEAQMDMTTCLPSSTRTQGHSMAQDAHMDMTICVPSSMRTQGHSMAQEAHMDMTTCVPSSTRTQEHSMAQEAHMDMTTCVPSSTRTQGHSMAQEAHMDMTTCVPSSTRPNEHHPVKDAKMNTVAVVESPSRTHSKMPETQMDTSAYSLLVQEDQALPTTARDISQPSAQQSNNFEDKTTSSPANPLEDVEETSQCYQKINNKAWTRPSCMETVTNDPSDVMTQHNQPHSKSFHSFKEHFNQSLLSHTMPLLGSQKKKISSFQSLPALSSFILQTSEASSKEPQITFGPTCDVPISQFCSQTAKKQKITHDTQKTIAAEEASIDQPSNNHISENDSFIFSKQDKECSPDKTETVVHPDNITFPFESKETTVDVGKLSSVDTFVLEQQGLPQQIFQEPDGGANITSQFEREALEQQCDDVVVEQDGEVSFKSFSPDKDKTDNLNVTETLSHSSMVGLMDEPTLEFSSDVLDDTVEQPNNESKECNIPKSPENTFVLGKKPTNLSVICEENDADFSKNASFNGNQEESRVTRKKITVAELLKRANISFKCPILQGSRRSIFGIIKKPEKPKEEKEMIKLSLALKPQALHYSEFCSSVQKDIEQLKTKIKQQEQELDNSETPILYYTSEDEMTQLANKLKDLKRTVCKESANARWIERSGVMKKRLASVLKDNRDQLSSDVAAIKQSLALAKDCNNLLNNIDSELDKGILALRDKIEKANKESGNIDEVQSTIKQKTSELESQETELRLLEERRSYLISSKETLTSKRENVEKEKLEREARLAREESERLSQEELFQEKYNVLKGILEWELDEWDQQHAKFLFLRQTLELLVMFQTGGDRTTVSRPIKSISLSSCLADDSHISAKFAHSLIQKSLDMKTLAELSPTSCSLSKALDHVSSVVVNARMIGDELYNVSFNHAMTMNDTRVSIMFSSMKAFMKFFVELDVDATKHPDNVTITVKPKIGQLCCEDIMAALKAVSIGPKYITRLVDTGRLLFDKK